jgi:hypothetical protein
VNIYPVSFTVLPGDQIAYNVPIRGRIVGISSTAASHGAFVVGQVSITIGGVSITDGFINLGFWAQLVVPLWYPDNNKIIVVDDIATVTTQNTSTGTTLTYVLTIFTAGQ